MGPLKILLVEDDIPSRELSRRTLADLGHDVVSARTAADGLSVAQQLAPDLTILDICLPDLCGVELYRRMRERHDIPAIFVAASPEPAQVRAAMAQGAFAYLVKPIAAVQLAPAIEAAMSRAAELRRHREAQESLATALNGSRAASVAVGVLMERFALTEADALARLKGWARAKRRKLTEISQELVAAANTINGFHAEANGSNGSNASNGRGTG